MGIKFLCEACGTKLNIKDDLAGKKGRCPKCNEKIMIPMQSTLQKTVGRENVLAARKPAEGNPKKVSGKPDRRETVSTVGKSEGPPTTSVKETSSAAANPSIIEPEVIDSEAKKNSNPATSTSELPPIPKVPTPDMQQPRSAFDEAPDASWFVRPASGGQFGPADASTLKSWLSEGRVGRDSLVWREGWDEWENAEEIFEKEFQGNARSTNATPPVPSSTQTAKPASNIAYHQMARRKAKTMGVILIVALVLLTIVLAVVLVLVANGTIGGSPTDDKETAAKLLVPATVKLEPHEFC